MDDDQRLRTWPPEFERWPRDSQIAYLRVRFKRPELIEAIGELADIQSIQKREIDPDNARLSKDELAGVALALGIYRRFLDREDDPWI